MAKNEHLQSLIDLFADAEKRREKEAAALTSTPGGPRGSYARPPEPVEPNYLDALVAGFSEAKATRDDTRISDIVGGWPGPLSIRSVAF